MPDVCLETERLIISELTMEMCADIHRNSLDEDTRRFVPDEVFETLQEAQETVGFLIQAKDTPEGPFVHPVLLKADGSNIGYVQVCRTEDGFEVGYHIAKAYTGHGYASEAVSAFVPQMMEKLKTGFMLGIAAEENSASCRVLEKCGFRLFFRGEDDYQGVRRPIRKYCFVKGNPSGSSGGVSC